jgi:hypothetical protein
MFGQISKNVAIVAASRSHRTLALPPSLAASRRHYSSSRLQYRPAWEATTSPPIRAPPTAAFDSGIQLSAYEKNWPSRLSRFRLQEVIPNDFFAVNNGYHDDEEPVAVQRTNVTQPLARPMTVVSLWFAQFPGRYSGGSHKILSEDKVTQSSLIPSVLTDTFE